MNRYILALLWMTLWLGCREVPVDARPLRVRPWWPGSGAIMDGRRVVFEVLVEGRAGDEHDRVTIAIYRTGTDTRLFGGACALADSRNGLRYRCDAPLPATEPALEWRVRASREAGPGVVCDAAWSPRWRVEVPIRASGDAPEPARIRAFSTAVGRDGDQNVIRVVPIESGRAAVTCRDGIAMYDGRCPDPTVEVHLPIGLAANARLVPLGSIDGLGRQAHALVRDGQVELLSIEVPEHDATGVVTHVVSGRGLPVVRERTSPQWGSASHVAVASLRDIDAPRPSSGRSDASGPWRMEGWESRGAADFLVVTSTQLSVCKGRYGGPPSAAAETTDRAWCSDGAPLPEDPLAASTATDAGAMDLVKCEDMLLPSPLFTESAQARVWAVALDDMDGDGIPEFVVGTVAGLGARGHVAVYRTAQGRWDELSNQFDGRTLSVGGDMDGDGSRDLAFTTGPDRVTVVAWSAIRTCPSLGLGDVFTGSPGHGASIIGADADLDGRWETYVGAPGAGGTCGAIYTLGLREAGGGIPPHVAVIRTRAGDVDFGASFAILRWGRDTSLFTHHRWTPERAADGSLFGQERLDYLGGDWFEHVAPQMLRTAREARCIPLGPPLAADRRPPDDGTRPSPDPFGGGGIETPQIRAPVPLEGEDLQYLLRFQSPSPN